MAIVEPHTFYLFPGQAVTHLEARTLLGDVRFARLLRDPIRRWGPTKTTIYPWNVTDYVQHPDLRNEFDAMLKPEITCPSCDGEGKLFGMFPVHSEHVSEKDRKPFVEIECDRCQGNKTVPSEMLQWIEAGKKLKQERLAAGKGLREYCQSNGIDGLARSRRERGVIDPETPDVPFDWSAQQVSHE